MVWLMLAWMGCTGGTGEESESTVTLEDTGDTGEVAGSGVAQLSIAQDFPCALTAVGEAACWGGEYFSEEPLWLEGSYRAVAAGVFEILAVREDGTLECVPLNGQMCGYEPEGDDFVDASIHGHEACVLREDGSALCWGDGGASGSVPEGTWSSVSVGHEVTCFLGEGRTVCDPPGEEPAGRTQVSSGPTFACGISAVGGVRCWVPELWDPSSYSALFDTPAGEFVHVGSGYGEACAIAAAGAIQCWGSETSLLPAPPTGTFAQVEVGYGFACAVDTEGGIQCWGEAIMGGGDLTPPW